MKTLFGHLTYCTNIHSGENWADHFEQLGKSIPEIKKELSPQQSFGIGLRLSNEASLALIERETLAVFQQWLRQQDCYVFTINGFPYGGFHNTVVKDAVHRPDWTTRERVHYTTRLANILAALLPAGQKGGISTSPLSYRHWYTDENSKKEALTKCTENIVQVITELVHLRKEKGKIIHLDIEPEPGGLLENGHEFVNWYEEQLLPGGIDQLKQLFTIDEPTASLLIREHVQLCYDVCHFAIGYENHNATIVELQKRGIKIGKIQISAALKATFPVEEDQRIQVIDSFLQFNEPVYLHQVIGRCQNGELKQYIDLPEALADAKNKNITEWRAHFHVPVFIKDYGLLQSTQKDIEEVLALQKEHAFTAHLEVETYTWDVLPQELKLPQIDSIVREMSWTIEQLNSPDSIHDLK